VRFSARVAIQRGTEVRDTAGGVSYTYETITGYDSIPATVLPVVDEKRQERMTPDEARWSIILGGYWPLVTPSHWVLMDDVRYEVTRVTQTKRRRVTTVIARQPSL